MATVTVKNIPDDIYEKLKKNASTHRRSINNEIIYCIENAVISKQVEPEQFIARIEAFHKDRPSPVVSDDLLQEYKRTGRS